MDEAEGTAADRLAVFLVDFFTQRYGVRKLAETKLRAFLACALKHHRAGASGRLGLFLHAVGLVGERTYAPELGALLVLMLRRAFAIPAGGGTKAIADRLNDGEGTTTLSVERSVDLVIGPAAKRALPETWACPQLFAVAAPRHVEALLDKVRAWVVGRVRARARARVCACAREREGSVRES